MSSSFRAEKKYALLGDSPVLEGGREDHLEFASIATVLAGAAVETANPLTIGVFGEWGAGKTSLMHLIKEKVESQHREHAAAVWFNAWQYEKEEHLIVPLVATISKELERKEKADAGWGEKIKSGAGKLRSALRAIAYGFSVKGKVGIPLVSEAEVNLSARDMVERYQELTKDSVLARSLYFDAFEMLDRCVKNNEIAIPRVVVFVDDLDRCFPDKAVELLEGIKLVLHQPGFSFVLGLNETIIQAFVKTKYEKDFHIEARHFDDYLDKMVQVKVLVPRRDNSGLTDYIENLLSEGDLFPEDKKEEIVLAIAVAGKYNPRSIVRLVNRIKVAYLIAGEEGRSDDYDPLALLIHLVMEEPCFAGFIEKLDIQLTMEGEAGKESIPVGSLIANKLAQDSQHISWTESFSKLKVTGLKPQFDEVVRILRENRHLFELLKMDKGRKWLADKDYRGSLARAAESTLGESRKQEETAVSRSRERIIRELLDNMVPIPGGEFDMGGDEDDDEKPVHKVKLSDFEIGATPVTQEQYQAVMGNNPSNFKGDNRPVENISWKEADEFCKKLSKQTEYEFTLPTEAQWEYACRAGSKGRYCFGDSEEELGDYAWYDNNSGSETHPVGLKKPNNLGLYDMHGNVWEWCADWFGKYPTESDVDPKGPDTGGYRVLRGGGWIRNARYCRSAYRGFGDPGDRSDYCGFRLARGQKGRKQET